jgi:hypothetical protein
MRIACLVLFLAACGDDAPSYIDAAVPGPDAEEPVPPAAEVAFPVAGSGVLPHGTGFPVLVAATDDAGIDRIDVVIDGAVVAGGPGAPTVWRSAMTGSEAGAASTQEITTTGWFEFVVPAAFTQKVVGLGDVDTGGVQADVDVGFYFTPVSFNGVGAGTGVRSYAAGDVFRLVVGDTTIDWQHNGTTIASAARPAGALHPEAWLPGLGAAVASAEIASGGGAGEPVTWTSLVDATVATAYAAPWNTTTRGDGDVAIVARATDVEGAVADSAPVTVVVDNTAPTCAWVSPTGGTVSGTVSLQATAGDASLVTMAFFVDGSLHSQHDGQTAATSPWNSATVGNGTHTLEVRAYDNAAHSTACPITVTVSNP